MYLEDGLSTEKGEIFLGKVRTVFVFVFVFVFVSDQSFSDLILPDSICTQYVQNIVTKGLSKCYTNYFGLCYNI